MMKYVCFVLFLLVASSCRAQITLPTADYLESIKIELEKRWPKNRMVNLVFHGHSVPTGYLTGGVVDRLNAYPFVSLKKIESAFKFSVVNCITTSIGGEQSEQGASRFKAEVLNHKPDVLFIDYGLNDRSIGIERTEKAWRQMIEEAKAYGTKVVLLTPTPDTTENISSDRALLFMHSQLIRRLAREYELALVDSYKLFRNIAAKESLQAYMAQNNHINKKGHEAVATLIASLFMNKTNNKKTN